ncbi:UNVERIFIED_CONTAM: hypothetical protein NCL1_27265 [Trichonephila clavipes]
MELPEVKTLTFPVRWSLIQKMYRSAGLSITQSKMWSCSTSQAKEPAVFSPSPRGQCWNLELFSVGARMQWVSKKTHVSHELFLLVRFFPSSFR